MGIFIQFKTRKEQHSQYDWADLSNSGTRIGKARCKIENNTIIIHTITIYPEYEGQGYGREFVEYCKSHFEMIVADRVRHSAIGFWENMGFSDNNDGNWVYDNRG
jgi:N-acetylglutamate synthase-like GNAT family acetyltransferase